MKAILAFFWIFPFVGFANSPSVEFQNALSNTGITHRSTSPTLGEPTIDSQLLADIRNLTDDQKKDLAAKLTEIIPQLAEEQSTQPVAGEKLPRPMGENPKLGILILQEIGTDEQKVSAFKDLSLYGESRPDAFAALATCEGDEGVNLIKKYAESQFAVLESQVSKDGVRSLEGVAREMPDVNIYHSVIALYGAYHPDGPVVANKLRNQLMDYCKSRLDATRVDAIEKKFTADMDRTRHSRETLIRKRRPDNKRNSEVETNNTAASSDLSDSSETKSPVYGIGKNWVLWLGAISVIIIAGILVWRWKSK